MLQYMKSFISLVNINLQTVPFYSYLDRRPSAANYWHHLGTAIA